MSNTAHSDGTKLYYSKIASFVKRHPGKLYFCCIPVFAFVFLSIPGDSFYHNWTRKEDLTTAEKKAAIDAIRKSVIAGMRHDTKHSKYRKCGKWSVDSTYARIQDLTFSETKMSFTVMVRFVVKDLCDKWPNSQLNRWGVSCAPNEKYTLLMAAEVSYTKRARALKAAVDGKKQHLLPLSVTVHRWADFMPTRVEYISCVFPFGRTVPFRVIPPSIPISDRMAVLTTDHWNRVLGFPKKDWKYLVRMFYLSVVTITTLGYGDIVPVSTWARVAVALESLFGIFFAGMFLSSLTRRIKKKKKKKKKKGKKECGKEAAAPRPQSDGPASP